MRPGRSAESEAGDGVTFERKVSAFLYTALAGENGLPIIPGTIVKVQLAVSHTGADVDDQLVTVQHDNRSSRYFMQCKKSFAVEGKNEAFNKTIFAIYETAAGRRQPNETDDGYIIVTDDITDFHRKGLSKLLELAKGHASMDELRFAVNEGEGKVAINALVAIDVALTQHKVQLDPLTLLKALKATHLWVSDVALEGSQNRKAALDALALRTDGTTFEEAEKLYNKFYLAIQDDGKRRAEYTFDSLRGRFRGFDRLQPSDRAAVVFGAEFFAGEEQELARQELAFDGGRAYESIVEARSFFDKGSTLIAQSGGDGPSKERYRKMLARALRLIGRGLAFMSLTRNAYGWVEKARNYADVDDRLAGQVARLAIELDDEKLYAEWFEKSLVTDRPRIKAAQALHQDKWQEALDFIGQVKTDDVETRFIKAIALRGLVGESSKFVQPSLDAADALRTWHGDRPSVQMAAAETAMLLTEPVLSSQYTTNPAALDPSFYERLADAEENLVALLLSDAGDFEAMHAAMMLIEVQGSRMSDQAIYGRRFDAIPQFAAEAHPKVLRRVANFLYGLGKTEEAQEVLRSYQNIGGDADEEAEVGRLLIAVSDEVLRVSNILPDLSNAKPQGAAGITRNGIYLLLKAEVAVPEEWLQLLAKGTADFPFDLEVQVLLAYRQERWEDFHKAFSELTERFPQAFECFTSLGRSTHELFRRKYVSTLKVSDDHALSSDEDDLQISPEGLSARDALLRILKYTASTFNLLPAVMRWIETAFNPPDVRELKAVLEECERLDHERGINLSTALLAYASQRYGDAADSFAKYFKGRVQGETLIRRLYDDSELRSLRFDRLFDEIDEVLGDLDRDPGRLKAHIGGLRVVGDERRAYSVAKANLNAFPKDRDALRLFFHACSGTSHQNEGIEAAMAYGDLYPDEWIKKLPEEEGLRIFQEQREDGDEKRKAYENCHLLLGQLHRTYIESWYSQLTSLGGFQTRRLGLDGRPTTADSFRGSVLMDAGPVLAASRYGLWPALAGKVHLCVHPSVPQWLRLEASELRVDLGEASISRAERVEALLEHKKITQRRFSEDEIAAVGEETSFGRLEAEAASQSGYRLIDSHDSDSTAIKLSDALRSAFKAGKIRPISYKTLTGKLGFTEASDQVYDHNPRVIFSSLDLVRLVDANVVDEVFAAFENVLVLPSTTYGLGMQFSTTLHRVKMLEAIEEACNQLQSEIEQGNIEVLKAESHPSPRGLRYFKEITTAAKGRVLWTDEAVLRQHVSVNSPDSTTAGTLEVIELMLQLGLVDQAYADDALTRMMVDGYRDYEGKRIFEALYLMGITPGESDFNVVCQRMGYLLREKSSRAPQEQTLYRHLITRQLFALAECVQAGDFEYLEKTIVEIIANSPDDCSPFIAELLHELGRLTGDRGMWQSTVGLKLDGKCGFAFGAWAEKETDYLDRARVVQIPQPQMVGLELLRFKLVSDLTRMGLRA